MIEKPEGALINLAIQAYWMEQVSILENVYFKFLVVGVGVVSDKFNEFSRSNNSSSFKDWHTMRR